MIDETEKPDTSLLSPTIEQLSDPYVLQLIETISKLTDIEEEAFMAGFNMADQDAMISPEEAYREWTEGR